MTEKKLGFIHDMAHVLAVTAFSEFYFIQQETA